MPLATLILPLLATIAAQGGEQPITVVGRPWAPFISPMGEPFRARTATDNTLARWFHQADRNQDGVLTADEMQADAERFFAALDTDHDGEIQPDELVRYEWQVAPDIQVNTKWKRARGEVAAKPTQAGEIGRYTGRNVDGYRIGGLEGAARYALLNIPQPVASADADLNRAVTLDEFRRAAAYRFQLLDSKRVGKLTLQDLQTLLPKRPENGARPKRAKNAPDPRVASPIPIGD
jgi:Ca2+-binding EF-hand superfamily protein